MHLLILGSGTAAISAARAHIARGGTCTLAHDGLPLGGTCLHIGCVPSKYLIRAAEQLQQTRHSFFPGLHPQGAELDQKTLLQDLQNLVTELRERNYEQPLPQLDGLEIVQGRGRLSGPRSMQVAGKEYHGDAILIATGSQTRRFDDTPQETPGLYTNESLFHLEQLPASMIVLGGGYIALELGQALHRLGVDITLVQRSRTILSAQPESVGGELQTHFIDEGMKILTGTRIEKIDVQEGRTRVQLHSEEQGTLILEAEAMLEARGRQGQTRDMGLEALGIELDANGFIQANAEGETACPGIYAAGDVLGHFMMVYTASLEAENIVARLHNEEVEVQVREEDVPWVVFTDPQVAGVGLSLEDCQERGIDAEEATLPVNRWPRFSSAREHRGYLKLVRDPVTDTLLGARVVAPHGGDLVGELRRILLSKTTMKEVANSVTPYLTLAEGIPLCAGRFA